MPFKTPGKTSTYIRQLLALSKDKEQFSDLLDFADKNFVPVLLPESTAFLRQIIELYGPKKILEIGTAIGYSGLIMLSNSSANLYTIEIDEQHATKAKEELGWVAERGIEEMCRDAWKFIKK